jgi:hypothetical protein
VLDIDLYEIMRPRRRDVHELVLTRSKRWRQLGIIAPTTDEERLPIKKDDDIEIDSKSESCSKQLEDIKDMIEMLDNRMLTLSSRDYPAANQIKDEEKAPLLRRPEETWPGKRLQ